jgi:hypothetical protein
MRAGAHDVSSKSAEQRLDEIIARPARSLGRWSRDVAGWVKARRAAGDAVPMEERAMLLIEKVIVLKTVAMFEHTPEELVAEIASIVEVVDYDAGHVLFSKGDAGESMYIVVNGQVRVFSASVVTTLDTRLFRVDGDLFAQLMAANVDIVRGVLHVLCERLRRTSASAAGV